MNRRDMLKVTASALVGGAVLGSEAFAKSGSQTFSSPGKVLVIGGHPDDPETTCGGTMAVLKAAGYDVVAVYLTRGESGIKGKTHAEAAAIRTEEAQKACEVLGVRPVFLSQIDGYTELNVERYKEMRDYIESENPDIVFTHWPVDLHRDHRVCSNLVLEAWKRLKYKFDLYFFEAMTGGQTQLFHPTDYVDITAVADKKLEACMCHVSQGMEDIYANWHHQMEQFRGIEFHCKRAEAFVHLRRSDSDII